MDLTSLDLRYLVRELALMADAKVEKVYESDTEKRDVLLTLYHRDFPKIHLRFLPGFVCRVAEKPVYPKAPPGFAVFLRKYIGGSRLTAARQRGFDRILELDFEGRPGKHTLVVEFLPPGNMILVTEGKIKNLLEIQQYKDRTLRGGVAYEAPPAAADPCLATDDELAGRISASTRDTIVTALAITIGLGGFYAEEACARAGIDKRRSDLTAEEIMAVVRAIRELFSQEIAPHADDARVYPFRPVSREARPMAGTFLEALGTLAPASTAVEEKPRKTKESKLITMLKAQEQQLARMEQLAAEEQRKGERMYEEYQLLSEILHAAQEARRQKRSIADELKRFPQVKQYDEHTGKIEVEIDDAL